MTKIQRYRWREIRNRPGVFLEIPKTELNVDQSYQRTVSTLKVREIASEWSWPACGTLTVVCRADGSFWIVNGQHRHRAAMSRADIDKMPCMVYELELTEESSTFLQANSVYRPLRAVERYKALLQNGNADALRVGAMLARTGYTLTASADYRSRQVSCADALLDAMGFDAGLTDHLWDFLALELGSTGLIDQRLVVTLFYLEQQLRKKGRSFLSERTLRERLVKAGIPGIRQACVDAQAFYQGKTGARTWASGVLNLINRKCRNRIELD